MLSNEFQRNTQIKDTSVFPRVGEDSRSVIELTQDIQPLSRREKLTLIEEISKMLQQEEELSQYFTPGAVYPIETPLNAEKAAAQLQQFLEQQQS